MSHESVLPPRRIALGDQGVRIAFFAAAMAAPALILTLILGMGAAGRTSVLNGDTHGSAALSSDMFLDSLGVNTHVNFTGPAFAGYQDAGRVKAALAYLGVRHIRDGAADYSPAQMARLAEIARDAHVRVDFSLGSGGEPDMERVKANLHALLASAPGGLSAIEGPNEINNLFMARDWKVRFGGYETDMCRRDFKAAIDAQRRLYAMVKSDPLLQTIPVYNFSVVYLDFRTPVNGCLPDYAADLRAIGTLPVMSDFDNIHDYPYRGRAPRASYQKAFARARTQPGQPFVLTETGYSTGEADNAAPALAVSEHVQAAYLLSALFDSYQLGARRTFLYELLDNNADGPQTSLEAHYGLMTADGRPKPAGQALHNLTGILADDGRGTGMAGRGLRYDLKTPAGTASGVVRHMALQKSDGRFYLAIWVEPRIWNADTASGLPAPVRQVNIILARRHKRLAVYDPLISGQPIARFSNLDSMTVKLTDHPILVEIAS